MIKIEKTNELFLKVTCDKEVAMEIYEQFTFSVPGHKFTPQYKSRSVGSVRFTFSTCERSLFHHGLLGYLLKLAQKNGWETNVDKSLKLENFDAAIERFIDEVIPDLILEPYDYQIETFTRSIKLNKSLVLSPTASGKSFIIYLIIRFLLGKVEGKVLISVPSTHLVKQMKADFCSYEDDRFLCDQTYELLSRRV